MDIPHQVFGSPSSIDYDIVVFVPSLDTIENCHRVCRFLKSELKTFYQDKPLNVNIAVLKEGIIIACFKGLPDELNNSLFYTYTFHQQYFPNKIKRLVQRDKASKILRSFRVIVSLLSRTRYRKMVKVALQGNLAEKINFLERFDFIIPLDFGKGNPLDHYKTIAFQIGQTLALIKDNEGIYAKADIYNYMKALGLDFSAYLGRIETTDYFDLQFGLNLLLEVVTKNYQHLFPLNEKTQPINKK